MTTNKFAKFVLFVVYSVIGLIIFVGLSNTVIQAFRGDPKIGNAVFTWGLIVPVSVLIYFSKKVLRLVK